MSILEKVPRWSTKYSKSKGCSIKPFQGSEFLVWVAIFYYMGIVKLPQKEDYWRTDRLWPMHKVCMYMTLFWFQQWWHNLHLCDVKVDNVEEPDGETEWTMEDEQEENLENSDDDATIPSVNEQWYSKAAIFINRINYVSTLVCSFPSFAMSINKMMKKFKGRCIQTFRIKNKPGQRGVQILGYLWCPEWFCLEIHASNANWRC